MNCKTGITINHSSTKVSWQEFGGSGIKQSGVKFLPLGKLANLVQFLSLSRLELQMPTLQIDVFDLPGLLPGAHSINASNFY